MGTMFTAKLGAKRVCLEATSQIRPVKRGEWYYTTAEGVQLCIRGINIAVSVLRAVGPDYDPETHIIFFPGEMEAPHMPGDECWVWSDTEVHAGNWVPCDAQERREPVGAKWKRRYVRRAIAAESQAPETQPQTRANQ
jgi:hypothetical protein